MIAANTPKPLLYISFICLLCIAAQSCKQPSELSKELFQKTQNKLYEKASPEDFALVFDSVLAANKTLLNNPNLINAYYKQNNHNPVFTLNNVFNGDVDLIADYFAKAKDHGLNPDNFNAQRIKELAAKLVDKNEIKTLNEAYRVMAKLEIFTANSLINYSNALQFGVVNPRKTFSRYFTETKRPDSISISKVFHINNMKNYLDSIQPKDQQYLALQKAYLDGFIAPGMSKEETKRYLLINMERLRWRNKPSQARYIIVNIPDFRLNVIDSGRSTLNMKVVVGEGRNMDNANTIMKYADSAKTDKPFIRETPQLNSLVNSVQVNPIWNIPRSIATKEIMVEAAKDPYYLSNKNIDVFDNGKLVSDPDTIDWSTASKDRYDFKQRPGNDNSLGKIKFLFKNRSNVYLHDTPAKSGFYKSMRALSHGCVRLGDPQALAEAVFGPGPTYDKIVQAMSEDNPDPTTLNIPKKIPVYITYLTCWADSDANLQFRRDVYGLDIVLYNSMQRFLAVNKNN